MLWIIFTYYFLLSASLCFFSQRWPSLWIHLQIFRDQSGKRCNDYHVRLSYCMNTLHTYSVRLLLQSRFKFRFHCLCAWSTHLKWNISATFLPPVILSYYSSLQCAGPSGMTETIPVAQETGSICPAWGRRNPGQIFEKPMYTEAVTADSVTPSINTRETFSM